MKRTNMQINVPTQEYEAFKAYCDSVGKTQTAVLRGFMRSVIPEGCRVNSNKGAEPVELSAVEFLRATVNDEEFGPLAGL